MEIKHLGLGEGAGGLKKIKDTTGGMWGGVAGGMKKIGDTISGVGEGAAGGM